MTPHDLIFYPMAAGGFLVAGGLAVLAERRGRIVALALLAVGSFVLWVALWLGSDLGYRAWQAMDDPPDEAYADPEPAGFLFMGWIPAGMFSAACYVMAGARRQARHKLPPPVPPAS
jgi:hypothetical protein